MKQIRKNIIWNSVGNTAYNGLQWLITVIAARTAGFNSAGILAIAMSLTLTFRTIGYFGIRNFQVSDSLNKYCESDYTGLRLITSTLSFIICMVFAFLSGYKTDTLTAILWYMIFRVSESFSDLFHGFMQKSEHLDLAGMCLTVKSVITTAAFAVTFFLSNSLNIGIMAMSISAVSINIFFEPVVLRKNNAVALSVSFDRCREMIAETFPLLAHLLFTAIMLNLPKYIISLKYDDTILGIYSSIFSVALIVQGIFQYISVPFTTEFVKLYNHKQSMKNLIKRIISIFIIITLGFTLVMQLSGAYVLSLVYGDELLQHRYMILPCILSVCAYCVMTLLCTLAVIMRKMKILVISQITGNLTCIIASNIFIYFFNINGVSYGFITGVVAAAAVLLKCH